MRIAIVLALIIGAPVIAGTPITVSDVAGAAQPQVAIDPTGRVHVVFGAGNAIYCSTAEDSRLRFGPPVKIDAVGALALGMRRGPRVAASASEVVVTAIGGKEGRGRDEDLLAWRSADNGKTWLGPTRVNLVPASAREGLHALAVSNEGYFHAVWLDLRLKRTQLYAARSSDQGATWENDRLVYDVPGGSICECCHPSIACDARGGLHVLWRNNVAGERDLYARTSVDGGKSFARPFKLGEGSWQLNACPMDGGCIAADSNGVLTSIWMRKKEVFLCKPGRAEESLGSGEQPWLAIGPGGTYAVWIEGRPGRLKALTPDQREPMVLSERAADPVVACRFDGRGAVVAAWEEGRPGAYRIRVALLNDE